MHDLCIYNANIMCMLFQKMARKVANGQIEEEDLMVRYCLGIWYTTCFAELVAVMVAALPWA